jgi:hypothetical protein
MQFPLQFLECPIAWIRASATGDAQITADFRRGGMTFLADQLQRPLSTS